MEFFQSRTLENLLQDAEICNIYEEYLASHFAWENFGFWYEVEQFKQANGKPQKSEIAHNIFQKFLKEDSIFALGDIDVDTRAVIESCLDDPPNNMFDYLQKQAFDTLAQSTLQAFKADYASRFRDPPQETVRTGFLCSCFGR